MSVWQPIETAPKSGKKVLLWWRTNCMAIGYYTAERPLQKGWPEEGWRCDGDDCIPRNQRDCTHWMPLPEPPRE